MNAKLERDGSQGESGRFLFSGIVIEGPLEALDATVERRLRAHVSLGDAASAERCARARDLARAKLESILVSARDLAGG
jgi:hypothetical protein